MHVALEHSMLHSIALYAFKGKGYKMFKPITPKIHVAREDE